MDENYSKLAAAILKQLIRDYTQKIDRGGFIKKTLRENQLIFNILDYFNFSPEVFISLLDKKNKEMEKKRKKSRFPKVNP